MFFWNSLFFNDPTDAGGHAVNGSLSLAAGQETVLNYTAYGPSATLTLMVQGGFTATAETVSAGQGRIRIKAPASIPSGGGKVMAFLPSRSRVKTAVPQISLLLQESSVSLRLPGIPGKHLLLLH